MKSVKNKTIYEQYIKKSHFISVIAPIYSEDEANEFLHDIKKEYPGANHYTYAYILGETGSIQKASDDGEPTRTAGYPMLEILLKNELTDLIVIVIRFFGGIKLGKGGLIRAYTSSLSEGLKNVTFTKKTTSFDCELLCSYDNIGSIDKFLRENTILNEVKYDTEVKFLFTIDAEHFAEIKEQLFNKNNYQDRIKIVKSHTEYI